LQYDSQVISQRLRSARASIAKPLRLDLCSYCALIALLLRIALHIDDEEIAWRLKSECTAILG
jgi:hypothetical protein